MKVKYSLEQLLFECLQFIDRPCNMPRFVAVALLCLAFQLQLAHQPFSMKCPWLYCATQDACRMSQLSCEGLAMHATWGAWSWELFGGDPADAFKQIWGDPAEHKNLVGQALGEYFHCRTIMFGVKSGP